MFDRALRSHSIGHRPIRVIAWMITVAILAFPARAAGSDQIFFPAVDNVIQKLVQRINAETVRLDISAWYLTEHEISIAIANRHAAGVPVRLIGDRGSIFEIDPNTKNEFYWLANQGVPIRLRFNPTWFPEIDHWKMAIFVGQGIVEFGSANWVTFELAPASSTNYDDETALFSDDPTIVNAFKTKFDRMWNDTTPEPQSIVASPPYLKDWNDACTNEPLGCDFHTRYPNPAPMVINTARLEPDYPMPPDLIWGQGPEFNNRLVQEINNEPTFLQFVIYRLTVDNITQALLNRWQAGVQMQLIVEPQEYLNRKWPEFWLTHANLDKLWAAGVPIKQRIHQGLTHMKTLVTAAYATNASSNYAAAWQRDHDYFISSATNAPIYDAIKGRVTAMWNDTAGFAPFQPQPPDAADLVTPASGATNVGIGSPFVWKIAPFAVSYDVYLGTSASTLTLVGNVPAQLVNNPPTTYSWTPTTALQSGTTYYWKIVSRTNATVVNPAIAANSAIWSFTTGGSAGPPQAPTSPSPSSGATGVSTAPTLGWASGGFGVSYNVAFGTSATPPQVATNLASASYAPGVLAPNTTYFWRITAVSSGGSAAGPVWQFDTGSGSGGGGPVGEVVIYGSDVPVQNLHGFSQVADSTAAAGIKLSNPDSGGAALAEPLANPTNYFDVSFDAAGGTRYRVWLRIHPIADSKFNDSVFVQYSDGVDQSGTAIYRMGTSSGVTVNLWTCANCATTGWGWQRNAYWLGDTGDVWFQNSGSHTIRVQVREDGVEIDQIVISPVTYATNPPGPVSGDTTIVPKPAQGPGLPATPNPANGAIGVSTSPTLTWTAAGATSYDVSFGTTNPPPLVVSGAASASYTPPSLADSTTYYWRIVARNGVGSTTGAVWSFTTFVPAPGVPASPSPVSGATNIPTNVTLTWTSAGATSYDVLVGPNDPPAEIATGITTASFSPPNLAPSTTYVWQIVAHNAGGVNQGPQWTFTTAAATQPPSTPTTPSPTAGATNAGTTPTLTWIAGGASSYDVRFGTINPPPSAATNLVAASYSPAALANSTTYYWQVVARNAAGSATGPVWSFTTLAAPVNNEVVIYASDVAPSAFHGAWSTTSDATAAAGMALATPDAGVANTAGPLAAPADYVDVPFTAAAGTYHFWMRMRALNNSKFNDSVYVQFSDARVSGSPIYQLNSTSALAINLATDGAATSLNLWGWQDGAYWLSQPTTLTFTSGGTHTLRIQTREDGTLIDQIILSPATYLSNPPGGPTNDQTIVPKPSQSQAPSTPASPSPATGAAGIATNATLSWTSAGATSYDVYFGTTNPPPAVLSQAAASYTPGTLAQSTVYYWQIVAHNNAGATTGPLWTFTTASPGPPSAPSSPSPSAGATGVAANAVLAWTAAGATSYDVQFGTANPPPTVSTAQASSTFNPGTLGYNTTYFWRVVAHNNAGSATGPLWSFATAAPPPPPSVPTAPTPANGSSSVAPTTTLTWSAAGAGSYDVRLGTTNPPPVVATGQAANSFSPSGLAYGTTYFWQIVAHNGGGSTTGPLWTFTTAAAPINEIVIYAGDIPAAALHGSWSFAADPTSPSGTKLTTTDAGVALTANAVASPADYVDVNFTADANRPYTIWLRMKALNNSKLNDSLWLQFSDALAGGGPAYRLNTTEGLDVNLATDGSASSLNGWGWQNTAYWVSQPTTLTFASSGPHILRIQVREDGVQLDQIVLSATTYLSTAPGLVTADSTIVPKP